MRDRGKVTNQLEEISEEQSNLIKTLGTLHKYKLLMEKKYITKKLLISAGFPLLFLKSILQPCEIEGIVQPAVVEMYNPVRRLCRCPV